MLKYEEIFRNVKIGSVKCMYQGNQFEIRIRKCENAIVGKYITNIYIL